MNKIKCKMCKLWNVMLICSLLVCMSLQVNAEPSRPSRAEQQTESSSSILFVFGAVVVAAAGGIVFMKKKETQEKRNVSTQPNVQISVSNTSNQNLYDYSELEATVAVDATVGWENDGKDEKRFYAEVIQGVLKGRKYHLTGQRTMIGRAEEANIRYPADTRGISRKHCQVLKDTNGLMIMDLGSSWGTFIEGKGKIPANQPVVVSEGDMIHLGSEENTLIIRMEV